MLGEIENEFNGPTQNALDYINATRLRAGLKKVEEVQPITTKSEYRTAMAKRKTAGVCFGEPPLVRFAPDGTIDKCNEETLYDRTDAQ